MLYQLSYLAEQKTARATDGLGREFQRIAAAVTGVPLPPSFAGWTTLRTDSSSAARDRFGLPNMASAAIGGAISSLRIAGAGFEPATFGL